MESIKVRQEWDSLASETMGHLVYEGTYRILSAGQFRFGTTDDPSSR